MWFAQKRGNNLLVTLFERWKKRRLKKRRKTQEIGDLEKAKGLTPGGIGADTKAWRSVSCNDDLRN